MDLSSSIKKIVLQLIKIKRDERKKESQKFFKMRKNKFIKIL